MSEKVNTNRLLAILGVIAVSFIIGLMLAKTIASCEIERSSVAVSTPTDSTYNLEIRDTVSGMSKEQILNLLYQYSYVPGSSDRNAKLEKAFLEIAGITLGEARLKAALVQLNGWWYIGDEEYEVKNGDIYETNSTIIISGPKKITLKNWMEVEDVILEEKNGSFYGVFEGKLLKMSPRE